jgi:hypothetical protein
LPPQVDWRTVREIAHRVFESRWPEFKCKPVSKDRLGRCCAVAFWNFIAQIVREAFERGVEDVESTVDSLMDEVDPELSRGENYARLAATLAMLGREPLPPSDIEAKYATYIDMEIDYIERTLREEEEALTPEQREELLRRLEELRVERERLLGKAKRRAEEEAPRRVEEKRVEKPERAEEYRREVERESEALPELPVEEVRHRIWSHIKARVPRAYRADWRDLRARISYHRDAEEELRRTVEELGGRVERVVEARPPLRVMEVDFSKARIPVVPLTPEVERAILWSKFSAILSVAGVRPEEYRDVFEALYSRLTAERRPFEEKQRRIEEEARSIAAPRLAAPPRPPVPPDLAARLEAIERAVRELREAVAWRPKSAEDLRMMVEASMLVEPRIVVRVDRAGHRYWGPSDECMTVLRSILDRYAVLYFESCPVCRFTLPGGALGPVDFAEHLISKEAAVPPIFIEWLRRLAATMEAAERMPLP